MLPCRDLKTYLDIGDIVGVHGGIRRTDKGELSVTATSVEVVAHSMQPVNAARVFHAKEVLVSRS